MSLSVKNKSIVSMLRDRELNLKNNAYFPSLKIASQLIRSDRTSLYDSKFIISCGGPISYESDYIYFLDYTKFCPLYAGNVRGTHLLPIKDVEKRKSIGDIMDMISYTGKRIFKDTENICQCENGDCMCLSQYLFLIFDDNWLCQYCIRTGKLMKQIYIKSFGKEYILFRHCDWDMYGERFCIATARSYYFDHSCLSGYGSTLSDLNYNQHKDVAATLAVFTTFPLQFYALMEIKRSVFHGKISSIVVSDQLLCIGISDVASYVNVYSFDDFLKQGKLTPYKLGDLYMNQCEIGSYPTGLPLNFTYESASPILFQVNSLVQLIRFGVNPYLHITVSAQNLSIASVRSDKRLDLPIKTGVQLDGRIEGLQDLEFHPKEPNKIVVKNRLSIDICKFDMENLDAPVTKLYSIGVLNDTLIETMSTSLTGLKKLFAMHCPYSILSYDYDCDLDIFAVLVKLIDEKSAFILLYDNETGEEIRCIKLEQRFSNNCRIYINSLTIVIIEADSLLKNSVAHVFRTGMPVCLVKNI